MPIDTGTDHLTNSGGLQGVLAADLAAALPEHFGRWGAPDADDVEYFVLSSKAVLRALESKGWRFVFEGD